MKLSTAAGVCAAAMSLALFASPASARNLPPGGMTYAEVADWLRGEGYPAEIKPDKTPNSGPEEKIVSSRVDGVNFDIYFYACNSGRCASIQYAAGWTSSPGSTDRIGAWNRDKRYIRAYTNDKQEYWAEYDIDIDPGGTYEQLDHTLVRWRSAIGEYKTYMGF